MSSQNPYRTREHSLSILGFASYEQYLSGELWQGIKARVLAVRGTCVRCGSLARTVHHASYELPVMRGDELAQLVPCCNRCHRAAERLASACVDDAGDRLACATLALLSPAPSGRRHSRRRRGGKPTRGAIGPPMWTGKQTKQRPRPWPPTKSMAKRATMALPPPRLVKGRGDG